MMTGPAPRPVTGRVLVALFLALAALPLAARFGAETAILSLASRMIILAIAAVALDLILGFAGLVSLGHAAFIGIGAYGAGIMAKEGLGEAAFILPAVILIAALFAYLTGKIVLRTRGVGFIMITLAFGQMLFFTAGSLSRYGGDDGLTLWSRSKVFGTRVLENDLVLYYVALAALFGTVVLVRRLLVAPFGDVLRAARENPVRVETLGINVEAARLKAYVISGVLTALAGFLLANQSEFVSPALMGWQRSGELVMMVVLGGMGTLTGPIVGAILFLLLEFELARLTEHWKLIFGPLLILVVLFGRGGLYGLVSRLAGRRFAGDRS
ncbi:MAG: branched-chain amino acid ABC transporter permease [Hyphomicrobiaceae bacterium]|nr:branched-chain amino acid ABC transporter permease [Hyphomicrobiaceae bacterium]